MINDPYILSGYYICGGIMWFWIACAAMRLIASADKVARAWDARRRRLAQADKAGHELN